MYYRIYQAKVLGALPSKRKPKKDEPEFDSIRESKDALNAAWETQKLFQDAICYYICALAGLSPKDHPTRQIVTKSFNQVSERFERYGIVPKTSTAEFFWLAIYGDALLDNEGKNILFGVFNQLSEEAHKQPKEGDSEPDHLQKLNTVISDNIQKLCWSGSTQAPNQIGTFNDNYFAELHRRLTAESLKVGFSDETFSESIDLKFCFKSPGNILEKSQALDDYKAAFGIGRTLKTLKNFSFDSYEIAQTNLRQETAENFKLKSLSGKKPNGVFWYCLRYLFCKDETSRNDLLKAIKNRKITDLKDGVPKDWIFEARAKSPNRRVFNYFTNWIGKPSKEKQGSWMPDFDKAALIKAAEIVFQYNIRTTDRRNRHSAAEQRLKYMSGAGFQGYCRDKEYVTETEKAGLPKPEQKKLGKSFTIVGFQNDSRNKAFDELMEKLDGGIGFTVTHPTLGGWKQIRNEFCKIYKRQIEKKSVEEIVAVLKAKVKECQSKDPTGFGSQKLFAALTEKPFWDLWLPETPALPFPAKNYLRAKASLHELKDKAQHLTEAINWTWPDAESSPREFKFDVAPSLKLGLSSANSELAWAESGKWQKKDFLLKICGMRLLRDGLGGNASSENPHWLPPLVAGMLPENPPKANTKKVSVNLSFGRHGDDNSQSAYLNFSVPLSASELRLIAGHRAVIKKGQREEQNSLVPVWTKQRQLNYYDDEHHSLRWPCDLKKDAEKEIQPDDLWCGAGTSPKFVLGLKGCDGCDKLESFRVLGVDLGLRRAIAFAVLEVNTKGQGRQISPEEHQPAIHAKAMRIGTHRLPGEDRLVFRVANKQDCEREKSRKLEIGKKYWLLEFSGGKGRMPDDAAQETKTFSDLRLELLPDELPCDSDRWSYSDQNDELLHCLKARLGRLKRFFRWSWLLFGTDRINPATSDKEKLSPETIEANKLKFIEELKPREDDKDKIDQAKDELKNLRTLAMQSPLPLEKIQAELKSLIKAWMELDGRKPSKLSRLAAEVANRAMPLRGKIWVWNNSDPKEPQLEQESKKDHQPETPGQRGLSIDRLEQIDRLRRCFMSIRDLGERDFAEPVNPGKGRDKLECCNELLKRLDRMKRQRVFQTAHLILQEALAERLTSSEEVERDHGIDQHGIYRPIEKAKPVELIFVEDLSRYKTSTDRTRRENSRLMKWCHGQIITKLKQMAEPFGLVVATIPPAYTSQFSARDGCAGVRVEEVTKQFEKRYPYSHLIKQETKKGECTELARHIQSVVDEFARLPNDAPSKKKRTLFVAVDGGPLFLPINRNKPDQADINAAINVALRGVAHPLRLDIYSVIRCEDKKDDAVQIIDWRLAKADKRFDAPVLADLHHKQEDAADISSLESDTDADEPDSYSNVCSIVPSGLNENSFKENSFYQLPNGQFAVSRWDLFQHVHWRARNTIETINKQRVDAWKQGKQPIIM